jgi:pyruvate/2-oxoglutarate dehydrogenase complex dihydrolipoamide dehydrogenase (E3) component
MTRRFDAIVIGAAQAGPSLASRLGAAGMKVAIIERHLVGGSCVNTGCKLTKTLVASAYAIHTARRGREYGVFVGAEVSVDIPAVAVRARKIICDSRKSNEGRLAGMANVELIRGHAKFVSAEVVAVNEVTLTAPRIFINVGGRAQVHDIAGIDSVPFLTNTDLVALDSLPHHLVVVGESYIGLEFAQM